MNATCEVLALRWPQDLSRWPLSAPKGPKTVPRVLQESPRSAFREPILGLVGSSYASQDDNDEKHNTLNNEGRMFPQGIKETAMLGSSWARKGNLSHLKIILSAKVENRAGKALFVWEGESWGSMGGPERGTWGEGLE